MIVSKGTIQLTKEDHIFVQVEGDYFTEKTDWVTIALAGTTIVSTISALTLLINKYRK